MDVATYLKNFTFDDVSNLSLFAPSDKHTTTEIVQVGDVQVPRYVNEFWTSKQRQASSIHEVSYRACFKPQLPRFFIELFTQASDVVYDPFSGRGTSVIEAGLLGRRVVSNDANPLSRILTRSRFFPPAPDAVSKRLTHIPIDDSLTADMDLSMFFHPKTFVEILSMRRYLAEKSAAGADDHIDRWIAMVATNRLTGHSPGFFSVYTLPPNQACSAASQKKINERRRQQPEYRNTKEIIARKTKSLLRNLSQEQKRNLENAGAQGVFLNSDAGHTPEIPSDGVHLTVTSPPFLNIVQYAADNWLRCWFNNLDADTISQRITMATSVEEWNSRMALVFLELYRIAAPKGWVAFEVGEVRNRTINLDEHVVPLGYRAGFECHGIIVNFQAFTKTANIWGVRNMSHGTNTNRIVLFRKAG